MQVNLIQACIEERQFSEAIFCLEDVVLIESSLNLDLLNHLVRQISLHKAYKYNEEDTESTTFLKKAFIVIEPQLDTSEVARRVLLRFASVHRFYAKFSEQCHWSKSTSVFWLAKGT